MGVFSRLSRDMGIDLGTANTFICMSGRGIVLSEPSVVALDAQTHEPLAFGEAARRMLGRTPQQIRTSRPLRHGVIADFDAAEKMLRHFIQCVHDGQFLLSPLIVIGIPSGVTSIERRAVMEAALRAGAREVRLIDEPVAAAIGADLPVTSPLGNMVVDIGGGTTNVAVLALQGTVISESLRVAGDELTEAIALYLKRVHCLVVGEQMAEEIKMELGSAFPCRVDNQKKEVRGVHLGTGMPRNVWMHGAEVRESMAEPLFAIVDAIKRTLERTPPELVADIADHGIILTGGGALLRGLDALLAQEIGVAVHVAEQPLHCVVRGIGRVLEDFSRLERVLGKPIRRLSDR